MEEKRKSSEVLRDLQKMIALELGEKTNNSTFEPLTDGLGLTSPKKPDVSASLPPLSLFSNDTRAPLFEEVPKSQKIIPVELSTQSNFPAKMSPPPPRSTHPAHPAHPAHPDQMDQPIKVFETKTKLPGHYSIPHPKAESLVEKLNQDNHLFASPKNENLASQNKTDAKPKIDLTIEVKEEAKNSEPNVRASSTPTLPKVGGFRRFFAFVIDQLFVWTLWLFAIIVTMKALASQSSDGSGTLVNFQNPLFVKFALMEFTTIWLAYLAIGVGIVDMTFGMWVWGLRLRYPGNGDQVKLIRKTLRVLASFLFFAPVIPSFFLIFRRRGRNLLDLVSGTGLYRYVL